MTNDHTASAHHALPAPRPLPAPIDPPPPCPHCWTRAGTRPSERPITRPRNITFGGGWVLATLLLMLLLIGWIVPIVFWIYKASSPEHEIIGYRPVEECAACRRPVER